MPNLFKQTLTSNPLRWWGVTVYLSLSAMVFNYDSNKADDASVYGAIGKWPWVFWSIFGSVLLQCTFYTILSSQQLRQPKTGVLPSENTDHKNFITLLKSNPIQYHSYFTLAILSCLLTSCNMIYLATQFNQETTDTIENFNANNHSLKDNTSLTLQNFTSQFFENHQMNKKAEPTQNTMEQINRVFVWGSASAWATANLIEVALFCRYPIKVDKAKRWQAYFTLLSNSFRFLLLSSVLHQHKQLLLGLFVSCLWTSLPWQQVSMACFKKSSIDGTTIHPEGP